MTLTAQHALELVTPAVANPILLSEAKAQLRVEHNDDDVIIARLINVATSYVDAQGALGACMMTQTWGQWLGQNPGTVTLLLGPVQSVSAVKYYDVNNALQTDTLSNYNVLGTQTRKIVAPKNGFNWPTTFQRDDAIQIQYVCGYGGTSHSVPQNVRHALMMLVAHLYENREATQGDKLISVPFGFDEMLGQSRGHWYG